VKEEGVHSELPASHTIPTLELSPESLFNFNFNTSNFFDFLNLKPPVDPFKNHPEKIHVWDIDLKDGPKPPQSPIKIQPQPTFPEPEHWKK
jgi:hypothetical protein